MRSNDLVRSQLLISKIRGRIIGVSAFWTMWQPIGLGGHPRQYPLSRNYMDCHRMCAL